LIAFATDQVCGNCRYLLLLVISHDFITLVDINQPVGLYQKRQVLSRTN
jgi:hypothetical protein